MDARSPLEIAFFLLAGAAGLTPDEVLRPGAAAALAARAVRELDPWTGHAPAARAEAVDRAGEVADLAAAVLADRRAAAWSRPGSRRQLFAGGSTDGTLAPREPSPDGPDWEAYAQRPVHWTATGTPTGGSPASGWHALWAEQAGDWDPEPPLPQAAVTVLPVARVFEVGSAADWHALATRYPRTAGDAPDGLAADLTPAWADVARDWDGVHLTFAGLLSAVFRPHGPAGARTLLWTWGCEQTLWLRDVLTDRTPLPPLADRPRPGLGAVGFLRAGSGGVPLLRRGRER